ncbi:MAG: hypothetical protein R3E01_29490 [Pirellulaceae bacterium]|nr:hypothetical protein [Planctomycetales bacterium]
MDRENPYLVTSRPVNQAKHQGHRIGRAHAVCPQCEQFNPVGASRCRHCGSTFVNELTWKIPVIVLIFLAAIALGIAKALLVG